MDKPVIKDFVCSKSFQHFRFLDAYKDKSDIEIVIEVYTNKVSKYCKENNLEIKEFSVRKNESEEYEIEIYFD